MQNMVTEEILKVLVRIAQFGAEQTYRPRYLHPKHEERQGGERAVNGVVTADPYLRVDIEEL